MVVLATKLYVEGEARERATDSLRSMVEDRVGALDVEYELGVRHDDFPSVTVSGPDEEAARNALRDQWGAIEGTPREDETAVGTLEAWGPEGIELDVGDPFRVPADRIGLGPGNPSQVRERFGLVQHLPMQVTVDEDGPRLADAERDRLYEWTRGTGRVNVNSATRSEVRATVNRAGHADDIVTIERLGLLEQSIVCREGTDPPGLLSSVGSYLPAEMLCVIP